MSHVSHYTDGSSCEYLTCAETAKLVRDALKQAFPGVKFGVRSKTYSGGASISVSWVDGPVPDRVRRVTQLYKGAEFDGMIDLKTHHDSILVDENGDPRVVSFGADFVFERRELSDGARAFLEAQIAEAAGVAEFSYSAEYDVTISGGVPVPCSGLMPGDRYASTLMHRLAQVWEFPTV